MAARLIKNVPAQGHEGCWRAGRFWPAKGTLVEVTDGKADVPGDPATGKPMQICQATYDALAADPRFSFNIAGSLDGVDALEMENAGLKAKVAALEAELAALKSGTAPAADDRKGGGKK